MSTERLDKIESQIIADRRQCSRRDVRESMARSNVLGGSKYQVLMTTRSGGTKWEGPVPKKVTT